MASLAVQTPAKDLFSQSCENLNTIFTVLHIML